MKRLLIAILAIAIVLMPTFAFAAEETQSTITTTGYATVTVEPDQAQVMFGVELYEDDAQTAQANVNTIIAAATEAIKAVGIEESKIKTQSINIYREYDYSGDQRRELGFHASTSLTVDISDIALTGAVIDAGLNAGLNNINYVNFSTSKETECYNEALAQATKNAIAKGQLLADAAEVEIAGIANITEGYSNSIYAKTTNSRSVGAMYDLAAESDETSVSGGELTISAQVTASFIIK